MDPRPADGSAVADEGVDCLVALDAGTGSGRCVVYDARGRPLATAREGFHYRSFPHPDVPFVRGFDLDPAAFWQTVAGCARSALATLPALGTARIRGVAATTARACVLLDRAGEVLYAGPNLDARAPSRASGAAGVRVRRLHAATGHLPAHLPLAAISGSASTAMRAGWHFSC
jgi:autoinducer 2 (AI-2) kinase